MQTDKFEISIGDTARLISELMNTKIEIHTDKIRLRPDKSEVERLYASNAKAKQLLDWSPSYSGLNGLRLGLSETIEWYKKYLYDKYHSYK